MYLDGRHKPVFISCLSTNTDTEVKAYQINRHQLSLPVLLRGTESSAVSGCCKSPPSSVMALEVRTRCWWNHMHTMTSSNGNILWVTDPLCGEFTGRRWIPCTKGQWRGALMFSLICAWINGWVNNREAGDLIRHRAHYDVTAVMDPLDFLHPGASFTNMY